MESCCTFFDLFSCNLRAVQFFTTYFGIVDVRSVLSSADYFPDCSRPLGVVGDEISSVAAGEFLLG